MATKTTLILLLGCFALSNGAVLNRTEDSYANIPDHDIKENLILDDDVSHGEIEGLLPPKIDSVDYYQNPGERRESGYVIDNENNTLKLKGEPENEDEELTSAEKQAMDEVTKALSLLLEHKMATANESDTVLHPVVILSDDGLAVEVASKDMKNDEVNVRDGAFTEEAAEAFTENYELTTTPETFTTDYLPADQPQPSDESGLSHFVDAVWGIMKSSIDYISSILSFDAPQVKEEEAFVESSSAQPSESVAPLLALEEISSVHKFPSPELEKGGRDFESLEFGRAVA